MTKNAAAALCDVDILATANFDQAFQSFRHMLNDYPDTPFLHHAYGSALDFCARYDEAEAPLLEQTRVMPLSALPYTRLAAVALKAQAAGSRGSIRRRSD